MLALLNQFFVRCDGKYFAMRNSLSAWNKSYSDGCRVYSLRNFCAAGGAKVPTISMRATQHKDLPVARAPEGVSQKCHAGALSLGRRPGGFGCCPVPGRVSKAAGRRESLVLRGPIRRGELMGAERSASAALLMFGIHPRLASEPTVRCIRRTRDIDLVVLLVAPMFALVPRGPANVGGEALLPRTKTRCAGLRRDLGKAP